ncbi:MAG: AlpA family phage regulatory protein [Methylibium sp.]|uniref:helix-turn-helix transcriptional regulator n=1 Tax=Methylibium sp. TaxID=2067992 RepID=UPI00180B5C5E|nr:AlpA family phage regulatory protein [Methylibium sp.]MBA3596470.1 AlpA family phage regulatory protein [Methylibium sp.]
MQAVSLPPPLLSTEAVRQLVGVGDRQFKLLRDTEDFPRPIQLGPRTLRWRAEDVSAWIASRPTLQGKLPEPAALARRQTRTPLTAKRDAAAQGVRP